MINPLAALSSPSILPGASIPPINTSTASSARSALDSSGSSYGLTSGATGSFSVGGPSLQTMLIVAAVGLAGFLLIKRMG